jgi:hypothetical protein
MKVRVVRNREGQVVSLVTLERTSPDEVLVEPVLEEGEETEDIEMTQTDIVNQRLFSASGDESKG